VFSTASVTGEQLQAMWHACSEIASQPDARQASRRLSERLSDILAAPTVVFRRDVSPWRLFGAAGPATAGLPAPTAAQLDQLVPFVDASYQTITGPGGACWTPIPLDEELPSQSLLLLPGDWRTGEAADWLPRFARTASMALRLAAAREASRSSETLASTTHSFARKLTQLSGGRLLYQCIIDTAARLADARFGGLSVYQPQEGAIAVAATHGYPSETVGHVRITPGSGIIGGVFSSKKPLLVRDTARVPGLAPRSRRYQTGSFMAVPILANEDALGVVTLADRRDGRPFTRDNLAAIRVISAMSSLALVREQLAKQSDALAHAAAVDPLTGMFNRRYLYTRLNAELEHSRRSGVRPALMMLDIDLFKPINDEMGHQAGDTVLRKVSEIVRRSVRASDVCTRYGGDEFCIVVPENASSAPQTAERIRQRVETFRWDSLGLPQRLQVTVSIGVTASQEGETAEAVIGRADQNLYEAKARGRNHVFAG
jgi:diguanylate cyclase (GGDEF)-like protein